MRICIVHNPSAGRADAAFAPIREAADGRDEITIVELEDPAELPSVLADAALEDCDVLAAAGGDGTVHLIANALMGVGSSADDRPTLAVLPLGTGNDYARTLAVPLDPKEALSLIALGERRTVEVIRIEAEGSAPCYAINVCSGGFTAEMLDALTDERKERWGAFAYLLAGAETLPTRTVYRVQLTCDDGPPEEHALHALVVASGRTAGGGQPIAPHANPEDGLLDVVAARAGTTAEVVGLALRAATHSDVLESDLISTRRVRRVRVTSQPTMEFVVDGEPNVETPLTFEAVPGALRVVVGADYHAEPPQG